MKIRVFQKGFNYSQDGRGNRLIWHLQGCNMHCPWCANPEGMAPEGVLVTDPDWLKESCCPKGAVKDGRLEREMCADCADKPCIHGMRQKGIRLSFREYEVSDMIRESVQSAPMFFDGGGVTLTGGEMSLQFEAVCALLEGLGEADINRCVETNGSHPRSEEMMPLVDEWIMDLKQTDSLLHRQWLGIGNERTLHTLEAACRSHPDVLIRIPLMPGFNDSEEDAVAFADCLRPFAGENVRAEVLTYHEFGKGKWGNCGLTYRMKGGKISGEQRSRLETYLKEAGLTVVRT